MPLSMIFDARKSAENSKQVRETNVATSRPSDAKHSSTDSSSIAAQTLGPRSDVHSRSAEGQFADLAQPDTVNAGYLGLRVERQADYWRVTWKRNIPVNPVYGRLSLVDGVAQQNLELRSHELKTGTISYSYPPVTDDVFLRLEIMGGDSPIPISESVRLTADSMSSSLARRPAGTPPKRTKSAARVARPRSANAQETSKDSGAHDFASVRSLLSKPRSEPFSTFHRAIPQESTRAFEPAKLIAGSSPICSANAQQSLASTSVEVSFRISPEGEVYNVKWLTGPPMLAQAATEAVESWLYEPARLNGAPIDSLGTATVKFTQE